MIRAHSNNSTIAFFEDEQRAIRVKKDPNWSLKSEIGGDTIAGDCGSIRFTEGKQLNTIVSRISNVQIRAWINKDSTW